MSQPYAVNIDAELARNLAEQGAALLFLDVPAGTFIGIDHQVFASGESFKGVKMLPPGVHFVSFRATSADGNTAPAAAFFTHLEPKSVLVRRWDAKDESLADFDDADEAERYAAGVRRFDFDHNLAPYNLHQYHEWQSLSCHISKDLVQLLMPDNGRISIMAEADLEAPTTEAECRLQQHLKEGHRRLDEEPPSNGPPHVAGAQPSGQQESPLPAPSATQQVGATASTAGQEAVAAEGMDVDGAVGAGAARVWGPHEAHASARCKYTDLPRLVKAAGATGAQLTALNLDKSAVVETVAAHRYGGRVTDVLGELQFAFVAFVYGQSLHGFKQWKALLGVLLCCEELMLQHHAQLLLAFLTAINAQLRLTLTSPQQGAGAVPLDIPLVDELLPDSFLWRLFGNFFQMLHDNHSALSQESFAELQKLKHLLRTRMGWEYEVELLGDSDDEYAPVVVDPAATISL